MLSYFIYALSFVVMFAGAAPLGVRDVVDPPITSPTAQTVWNVGTTQTVTWDTSGLVNLTQPLGTLLLGFLDTNGENLIINSPLGKGFQLTDGSLDIIVPSVPTRDNYIIALLGSSGNISPTFTINNNDDTQSSVSASGTFESTPATTPSSSPSVSVSVTSNTTPTSIASVTPISSHGASFTVNPSATSSTLPSTALSASSSVTSTPSSSPVTSVASATSTVPSGSALSDVTATASSNNALSWRVGREMHGLSAAIAVLATLFLV